MMVLAILAAPTSGLAGTPDAHSEIVVVADLMSVRVTGLIDCEVGE